MNTIKTYTALVIFSLLLTPSIQTPAGIPAVRIDDLLLILFPIYLSLSKNQLLIDRRILLLLLICLSIQLGILSGALLGYPASLGDLFFMFRIAKYLGAVLLGSTLLFTLKSQQKAAVWFIKTSSLAGILLVPIVIQQYFNWFGLNSRYVPYVAPTQYRTLVDEYPWPRPVGLVGNANELSFLFGILSIFTLWMFLFSKERGFLWILTTFIFFGTAALTLSRSGVFATFAAYIVLISGLILKSFKLKKNDILLKKRSIILVAILIIFSSALICYVLFGPGVYETIGWRFTPEYYGSFYKRVSHWHENINLWLSSPIFGVGTLKHSGFLKYAADNEWLLFARIGGITLVTLIVSLLFAGVFQQANRGPARLLGLSIILGGIVYMIPAAFYHSLVIMPLSLMILTIALPSYWKKIVVKH